MCLCVSVCVHARSVMSDSAMPWTGGPPGSSVHGIPQAGTLGCVAISMYNISIYSSSQEKAMATHSSILAWKILWIEEPGGLLS